MLTAGSPGLPGTWWTSIRLIWLVTGHWGLHSLLEVCRRLFFCLVTSLWTLLFGFGFSAEGFTSVPGYDSCQAQGCIFPSALPWTQKIQCQGTEKAITLNPQSAFSSHSLTCPIYSVQEQDRSYWVQVVGRRDWSHQAQGDSPLNFPAWDLTLSPAVIQLQYLQLLHCWKKSVMVIIKRFLSWESMLAESLGVPPKAALGAGCLPSARCHSSSPQMD